MLEAIINLEKLGRGYNSGYGKVKILRIKLVERNIKKDLVLNDEDFTVQEVITEKSLKQEVLEAKEAFSVFITAERNN
ncbi:MAG: hypothetical protein ACFFC7_03205 [Candidatus Hermodarchaeota archaeon]